MLKIKNLNVKYGVIEAVRDVSFEVKKNSIVTIIGSNGAGKSSILNSIMNLVKKDGLVYLNGADISKLRTDLIVKKFRLSLVPEGRRVFINLTVQENLKLGGYNFENNSYDINKMYKLFPRLKDKKNQLAKNLSGGEQQMLALARALMSKPKFLLLDEPSLGLAPKIVSDLFKIITQLKEEGLTILLVEQNAHIALSIADFGYVLENGEIVLSDEAKNLLKNEEIVKKYLGG